MLRIIVELMPGGDETRKRELARAHLGNVSNLEANSDYVIFACEGDNMIAATSAWESHGVITRHYRHQSVWALVAKAASWATKEAEKPT